MLRFNKITFDCKFHLGTERERRIFSKRKKKRKLIASSFGDKLKLIHNKKRFSKKREVTIRNILFLKIFPNKKLL